MQKFQNQLTKLITLFCSILLLFSCSKDADLLSEYVINTDDAQLEISLLINDTFFIEAGQSTILMDVLNNDNFNADAEVRIIQTSEPLNGIVTINDDNTLTYKVNTESSSETTTVEETTSTTEEINDTFNYTTEEIQPDGTVTNEQATVTITSNANKNNNWYQSMFTDAQISLMIQRVESGYSRPGTNGQDIQLMISKAEEFNTNPSNGRLDWMPSGNLENCFTGCDPVPYNVVNPNNYVDDNIFYAGLYAFIIANRNEFEDLQYAQSISNNIAEQTLARAKDPNLDFSNRNIWLDGIETNPFFLTAAWLEKTMNNWALINSMNLVSNLSEEEEKIIDDWFKKAGEWAHDRLSYYYLTSFGGSWETDFTSTGWNNTQNNTKSVVYVNGKEKEGYVLNQAAALIGWNTTSKFASLVHTYGLLYQDQEFLDLSEKWFKDVFKLGVFPDGTSYELIRASASNPSQGLQYWSITESQLVSMANTHAVAVLNGNPVVNGRSFSELYDYTTSDGLSDLLPNHVGSDTKGGEKGLKNYLLAHAKYLGQSTGLNGWGEIRQVNEAPYPTHSMPKKFHYFVSIAQANAYYNNSELKSLYSGTNGYQVPKVAAEGADGVGAWSEAYMGGFGKWMVAFPYLETEGIFYTP
ncbi:hypothetical protein [Maribacter dokdonensis]|uniref:hypothetical protein n=1 Tax=Maribacter dokdonensis TaxID=320912 RepID=UPI002AB15BFA|nr:hypothetical protein [Maribacter dokdonensis]